MQKSSSRQTIPSRNCRPPRFERARASLPARQDIKIITFQRRDAAPLCALPRREWHYTIVTKKAVPRRARETARARHSLYSSATAGDGAGSVARSSVAVPTPLPPPLLLRYGVRLPGATRRANGVVGPRGDDEVVAPAGACRAPLVGDAINVIIPIDCSEARRKREPRLRIVADRDR